MLPHDPSPLPTVHKYTKRREAYGTRERVHDALRSEVRRAAGRNPEPGAAAIDSQSVKTTLKWGSAGMTPAKK